jgi:tetratricopeptide (TPR) repeat protein
MRIAALLWPLLFAFAAAPAGALEPAALAQEALTAYSTAQAEPVRDRRTAAFAQAEQIFAALALELPDSAAVQVNLGNAALQAQHLGVAVLSYKRALRVDPNHPQAERNLQHARELLPAWVPRPAPVGAADSLFFWHSRLSRTVRATAAAFAFALAGASLGAGLYRQRRGLRGAAAVFGLVWLGFSASLAVESRSADGADAVLLAEEAVARVSDSAFAASALAEPLPAGTELQVLAERGSWLQARLANGRTVWLRTSGVARVAPEPAAAAGR